MELPISYGDADELVSGLNTDLHYHDADRDRANHTGEQAISTVTGLQAALDEKEDTVNKGVANGYASLDSGGKVPAGQLPSSVMEYKGLWNASTNTPTLADGTGDTGDVYKVSVAGTQDLGSGPISFEVNEFVMYSGTVWERSPAGQINQPQINRLRFGTVAEAEAATFLDGEICFVEETGGQYYYLADGSDYTRDGDRYLNTGAGGNTRLMRYTGRYTENITKEPTGFFEPKNIIVTYDSTARTITLTGTVQGYWRGVQIPALVSGWVSPAHATGDNVFYLYYNGTSFVWSTTLWKYSELHIARVVIENSGAVKIAFRECHGFQPAPSHHNDHQNIGTWRTDGTGLLPDTSYALDSTTPADRRPDINLCELHDEDLLSTLPALTSNLYSWWYRTGTDTVVIDNDHTEIINLSGDNPYWNENNGGTWQWSLFPNNHYGKIFIAAIPVTADTESQKYRFVFVPPQETHLTLAGAQAVDTLSVDLGGMIDEIKEVVFIAEIIIQYTAVNWVLKEVNPIFGSRASQVTVVGSAAGLVAAHEAEGTHPYDNIILPDTKKDGTPTEALNLSTAMDYFKSAGLYNNGAFAVTNNGDGTVDVAGGEGTLRVSASETASLHHVSVPAKTDLALTDNSINYIYASYNSGSPVILATTDFNEFNCLDKCIIWRLSRAGTDIHIINAAANNVDSNRKYRRKSFDTENIIVVRGTALTADEGTRHFSVSAGRFWFILSSLETPAYDTSGTDTFSIYHGSGTTWAETTGQTQISNTTYNDGTTTPATLGVGKSTANYVFISLDEGNAHIAVVAGGEHKNPEEALAAPIPAILPPELGAVGVYIATIVIEQGAAELHDPILIHGGSTTQGIAQTSHNALPGKQGGDDVENDFYHLPEQEHNDLVDPNAQLGALHTDGSPEFAGLTLVNTVNEFSTDGTLAGDSDTAVPTEKAVKTYADTILAANDAMVFKGAIDCSANPNYPAADAGHTYRVSVAGKIGGASGSNVEVDDTLYCIVDSTASGDHATVGANWTIVQSNLDGAVIGPVSSTNNTPAAFDGTTGKLIKEITAVDLRSYLNVEDGADVTDAVNIASSINGSSTKSTPVDADVLGYLDSGSSFSLVKATIANIKAFFKTYFDTIYEAAFSKNTAFNKNFGTTTGTVCEGDDSRLSPPGTDGKIPYNNGGAWGASNVTYDDATARVGVGVATPAVPLEVDGEIRSDLAVTVYPSGEGRIKLSKGGPTQTGYIEWRTAGGVRFGYIGYDTANLTVNTENGAEFVVNGITTLQDNLKLADGKSISTGSTTGTIIGTTGEKIGFLGATPVARQAEITDELTTITYTAPTTPDYAIQDLTDSGGFGFVTKDEGNTVLSVIKNLQDRVNELESVLATFGFVTDAD
jgi:hypothetical protein